MGSQGSHSGAGMDLGFLPGNEHREQRFVVWGNEEIAS